MLRTRRLLWAAALALTPLLAPAPAHAVGEGDLAPVWEAKEFIHSDVLTLPGLRGRLVFCEYFGTT